MSELPGPRGRRSPGTPGERWSFGGATAIETAEGVLLPEALVVGTGHAALHARWRSGSVLAAQSFQQLPGLADVAAVDDQGVRAALHVVAMSSGSDLAGDPGWPMIVRLDPVPAREVSWLELRSGGDAATRLTPSMRTAVRIGRLTSTATESIPADWSGRRALSDPGDGSQRHLDLGSALPPIDGVTVRADSLFSWPGHWRLYLRAMPGWWKYAPDRSRKWSPLSVMAEDDRGGRYVSSFGGSTGAPGLEELALEFLPRLDPLARTLTLVFHGAHQEVPATIDLEGAAGRLSPRAPAVLRAALRAAGSPRHERADDLG